MVSYLSGCENVEYLVALSFCTLRSRGVHYPPIPCSPSKYSHLLRLQLISFPPNLKSSIKPVYIHIPCCLKKFSYISQRSYKRQNYWKNFNMKNNSQLHRIAKNKHTKICPQRNIRNPKCIKLFVGSTYPGK